MNLRHTAVWLFCALLVGGIGFSARGATTYHVRTDGNDMADGESWANAWASISNAVEQASGGDTIVVSNGLFEISAEIAIEKGVTLQSFAGAEATEIRRAAEAPYHRILYINHADAVVDGFTLADGVADKIEGTGTAPTEFGGGLYMPTGLVTRCILVNNQARSATVSQEAGAGAFGGGAYLGAGAMITHSRLDGSHMAYNHIGSGAAVHMAPGSRIEDSIIENSRGYYAPSAALFLDSDTVVLRCIIRGNRQEHAYGGGIDIAGGGNIRIEDCVIHDNVGRTGGIHIENASGDIWVRNSLIARNYGMAPDRSGGIYRRYASGTLFVENCTIVGNIAFSSLAGGGLSVMRGAVVVRNSIITGNVAPVDPNYNISGNNNVTTSLHIEYTCTDPLPVAGGYLTVGPGNIAETPVFADPAFEPWGFRRYGAYDGSPLPGNARLMPGSPTINAGTTLAPMDWVLAASDLDGNARVVGTSVDMGCFEYDPGVLDAGLTADAPEGLAPHTVELTAHVDGSEATGIVYYWNFGDGSPIVSGADKAVVTNQFAAGLYDVSLTVSNAAMNAVTQARSGYVKVAPPTVFVAATGLHQFPFDTPVNAATDVVAAVSLQVDGGLIQLAGGTYAVDRELFLDRAVTLRGDPANASSVVLDGGLPTSPRRRVISLIHPDAVLEGVTIQGGLTAHLAYSSDDESGYGNWVDVRHHGAGVLLYAGGLMQNCIIRGNQGTRAATAVAAVGGGMLRNCLVTANQGYNFSEHVRFQSSGNVMENCTIVDNVLASGNVNEYALTAHTGSTVANSIIRFNASAGFSERNFTGLATVLHCNLDVVPADSTGVQTGDPEFVDRPGGNYRLKDISPCIDAGVNRNWEAEGVDLDGNPRLLRGTVDIGAYEFFSVGGTLLLVR